MKEFLSKFEDNVEKLNDKLRILEYANRKANSILEYLDSGIIIVDECGNICEYNKLADDYFKINEFNKMHLKHISKELNKKIGTKELYNNNEKFIIELEKDNRLLYIKMGAMGQVNAHGYLISVMDVTKIRRLESIKSEFITNITHELKTPLTSIQGFVETLQNGALDNPAIAKKFLNIISIETKRLYSLIQDILSLSEIESMNILKDEEDIKLKDIILEIVQLLEPQALEKNIQINLLHLEDVTLKEVNQDYVKQFVTNLISNAIKYTDEGKVEISLNVLQNKIILVIEDTGIGISAQDIDRIFERFYRVDKSRSRKSGGTGIGLSIVKHIAQLYNWEIEVDSEEGNGTMFKITFNN
ncbi:hypothetical protein AN639_04185 [Candidatus Epulonipiscium fishelsonii]|uniref:Uncharacterized protein n=1 Tax=Candidatus Epulonipiscium fishelsonii TaxID=77094 RepID=A0ACC8X9Z3_9FIRM|nr:hypothetical protein AN396_09675 [Epulopiscium sp. SCG-B11WGA-EpuloA1]ONI40923.1 hypothetical protein AN639_04185 [Epulopiscium sp. SCG-B05WGA-EpuloA1]